MKRIIARETLLAFPNFNEPFHIYTDASKAQLGAVITQKDKPIAFYSRKLNPAQTRYTTTERELLSIVETFKEFKPILLGQQLIVHTDHLNLTYKKFNTDRVMRWRLLIEEFSPTLKYIQGTKNIVADLLSRLDLQSPSTEELNNIDDQFIASLLTNLPLTNQKQSEHEMPDEQMAEYFGNDEEDPSMDFPLSFKEIGQAQTDDKDLMNDAKKSKDKYTLTPFRGGGKSRDLLCYKDKIVIPKSLRGRVTHWYHHFLAHPGINRTEETIRQHLWWPGMRKEIAKSVSTCLICQKNKRQQKKFGLLPEKEAEYEPWQCLCVDLIGPYRINIKGKKDPLICKAVTMIDPATGWFEIEEYSDKKSISISNIVEQTWLTRYPWPQKVINDRGTEFTGSDFKKLLKEDYGVENKPISSKNPQANAILERVHQTLGNIVRTFEIQDNYVDEEDPWKGILSAAAFAIRSTYHTTLQKTPGQLVFGRDMILNIKHTANWEYIRQRKQKRIAENNKRENAKRTPYTYQVGQKVMLTKGSENKYETPYSGPHVIQQINTNGTVRLQKGSVTETINIRRLKPFRE